MLKERKNPLDKVRQHAVTSVFNDQFECPWSNKIWRKVWLSEFIKTKEYAESKGIVNIVFNKIVGSLQNIVSSKKMETMLKKWRSGIEAVISNYKRGFGMFICNWKGKEHYKAKVLWSAIAYNIRVMTRLVISQIKLA